MKAIAVVPGVAGSQLVNRPEPSLTAPDQVKLKVLRVGICGTDREEVSGGRALLPAGQKDLVIGHEMLGQVVEVGRSVTRAKAGDLAVFTVRRGCGECASCAMHRADMCETGDYKERGIWGLDGYQAEFVVDTEAHLVPVPAQLAGVGVLIEPLTIVEKAISEALRWQQLRRPDAAVAPDWIVGRRCLVAGLGPVGLLAALVLRLRGAEVFGLDIADASSPRPQWLISLGGHYVDGRAIPPGQLGLAAGNMDLIVEAAGIPSLEFNLFDAMAFNGVYVLTGIPGGHRPLSVDAGQIVRHLVLHNLALLGSVNAARGHFQMAVDDLLAAHLRWPGKADELITHHHPLAGFQQPLAQITPGAIKEVIEWQ